MMNLTTSHDPINSREQLKTAIKAEIIKETIENLLAENDGTFDLTTSHGIESAVEYMVDYLAINKFEVDPSELKAKLIRHLPASKI